MAHRLKRGEIGKQLVKFLVIGGCSFLIDFALRWLLLFGIKEDGQPISNRVGEWLKDMMPWLFSYADVPYKAAAPLAFLIASTVSILFNFTFSRLWTFGIRGREGRRQQLRRFIAVYAVALAINTGISTLFSSIIPATPRTAVAVATVIAAAVGAAWNFAGQRLYAFKTHSSVVAD